jgi:hypothetical protein
MTRYIVNPGNAVHSVEESEFKRLTLLPGYREATTEEIAGWYEMQGLPVPPEFSPANERAASATDDDASQSQQPTSTGSAKQPRAPKRARTGCA